MDTKALLERQQRLWDTAHDNQRWAALTADDLAAEVDFATMAWTTLVDPVHLELRADDPDDVRMDLREYLRALLILATRVRERWSLADALPRETLAQIVEYMAGNADDGDGPSEAYTLALQLRPDDADLLARLLFWIESANGYVYTEGFDNVAEADPERAAMWRSYNLLATFAQYCNWKTHDDAVLILVDLLQYRSAPPLAAIRELAASKPWSLPLPSAEDWELIESFLEG